MAINWKERVKKGYDEGFYDKSDVAYFVERKRITEEDFYEITGVTLEEYKNM